MTSSTSELAEEIRRYCALHPGARDSLEGIAWWLALQRQVETREELRAAVDLLVERGELVAFELADGSKIYGCS